MIRRLSQSFRCLLVTALAGFTLATASAYGTRFVVQTSSNAVERTDVLAEDLDENTGDPGVPGTLTFTLTGPSPRFVRLQVTPE